MPAVEYKLARAVRRTVDVVASRIGLNMAAFSLLATLAAFVAFGIILRIMFDFSLVIIVGAIFIVYLATGGWRFMRIVALTIRRDLTGLSYLIRTMLGAKRFMRKNTTIDRMFDDVVAKNPDKTCFMFQDTTWRFIEFQSYVNKVANFLYEQGYRKGDVIAVFSENCPEMVAMWLGMSRLGVKAALINFNLRDVSLTHCIKISSAKAVIFGSNMEEAIAAVSPDLPKTVSYISLGRDPVTKVRAINIDQELSKASTFPPPRENTGALDTLFYIYTSGTTGLPKAAKITHLRYFLLASGIHLFSQMTPDDVLYTSLPLYHTAAVILGIGQCLLYGTPIAIRQKFSASQFWNDCIKYKATATQYIGEICRYLLAQPPKPEDRQHTVRVIYGNGLKPQIWRKFQERFGVDYIMEFYGATEGNCSVVNNQNVVGAIGFTTRIAPALYPITLVKVDPDTNQYVRDSHGICVKCKPGEPGEIVGKIVQENPLRAFEGYVNESATSKKIINDVFRKGDMAFSSGDILVMDELGYLFFRDRTGDTFRWRGENVSTNEVEAIISNHIKYSDAVVYGVEVPGCEGRAGMVAMVSPNSSSLDVDVASMGKAWCQALPPYARPVFVRILTEADTTGTFKLKKNKLRDDGFDPSVVQDPVYFLDPQTRSYIPLQKSTYDDIVGGALRL